MNSLLSAFSHKVLTQSQVDDYIRRMSITSSRRASSRVSTYLFSFKTFMILIPFINCSDPASSAASSSADQLTKLRLLSSRKWYHNFQYKLMNTTAVKMLSDHLIRKFTLTSVWMYTFTMVAYYGSAYYASNLPGNKKIRRIRLLFEVNIV